MDELFPLTINELELLKKLGLAGVPEEIVVTVCRLMQEGVWNENSELYLLLEQDFPDFFPRTR